LLNGRFSLRLNHNLPMGMKIERYAHEEVAFYLHKKRNFITKIKEEKKEYEKNKMMKAEEERIIQEQKELQQKKEEEMMMLMA